ncbi:MAG: putative dehydrogenase, partial [Dehalococcoidia bacterium]|nr:putative dehydrogenase [Dehalococcoidia bacterium]
LPGFISEGYEVVAVCASRKERAEAAAEKFGVPHAFTDIGAMLKMPGLDAVSVVTPPYLHEEMGVAVLKAGKHVLLEKPFAVDVKEAWSLLSESKKRPQLAAMVGHEFRFAPPRRLVKELLEQEYLGRLNAATVSLLTGGRPRPAGSPPPPWGPNADVERGGGLHKGLGSHYIDCLRDWFGDIDGVSARLVTNNPERLEAATGKTVMATADDAFGLTVSFARGGWATMTAAQGAPFGPGARFELYGSQGTITTSHPGANPTVDDVVLAGKVGDKGLAQVRVPEHLQAPPDERDHRLPSFRILVQRFADGIRKGSSPEPSFLDGFRSQQVMDGMLESHRTGRYVTIELAA